MHPILLAEGLVKPFHFFLEDKMRRGICHGNDLYGWVFEFDPRSRSRVYETASALIEQEVPVVITASSTHYTLWVSLRSFYYQRWLTSGEGSVVSRCDAAHLSSSV